jgi:hypothetical protein
MKAWMPLSVCKSLLVVAIGLVLAACATTPQSAEGVGALSSPPASAPSGRELMPDEKKVIADAVGVAIPDPASAKYRWSRFRSTSSGGSGNYCAMVNAKSQHPAYSGWQAYIVSVGVTNGRVTSAVIGAIAGGHDIPVIKNLCKRYGLDPSEAV